MKHGSMEESNVAFEDYEEVANEWGTAFSQSLKLCMKRDSQSDLENSLLINFSIMLSITNRERRVLLIWTLVFSSSTSFS